MKTKIIAAVVAMALGIGANAAVEKVLTIQVADKDALEQAATTAGNLVGYPILGMTARMTLADNPVNKELGEFRAGESLLAVIYADPDKATTADDLDKAFAGIALVYAPAKSKQDFLTSKEGLTETDGIIQLDPTTFIAYSEDDKWATAATSAEFAKSALAEIPAARKPMDGNFVSLGFSKPGVKLYAMILEDATKEVAETGVNIKAMPSLFAMLNMLESGNFGFRLREDGLDMRGSILPVAGSDLSKIFTKPLEGDALAFAPANSLYVTAASEGAGFDGAKALAIYDGIVAALKEAGLNTDWYKSTRNESIYNVALDIVAAIAYFTSEEGQTAAAAVDTSAIHAKVQSLYSDDMYKIDPASKPFFLAMSIPGVDSKKPMSELFAKILPDAAAKKPSTMTVCRYYSAIKALAPVLAKFVPEESASVLNAAIASLPSDDGAATAGAAYREGDSIAFTATVSAQEIRGFAALFNAGVAYFGMLGSNDEDIDADDEIGGEDDIDVGGDDEEE